MILQALYQYYQRLEQEGESASEGFEKKEIPFLILLSEEGEFLGFQDTREGEGKKKNGRLFAIPKATKRSVGVVANLLWDSPVYIFGRPKIDNNKDQDKLNRRAKEQQVAFLRRIKETFIDDLKDKGINAVVQFLEKKDFSKVFNHKYWKEIEESGANLTFMLQGDSDLVCQRAIIASKLNKINNSSTGEKQTCLVTGELAEPTRLHTAIKGVWGAQPSGANIVSFNLDAFNSYNKTQGYNAPISKKAESAYTAALNILLAKSSLQRIQVGDASTVFWAARKNPLEDMFADFFGEKAKENSTQDNESIKALYKAPEKGTPPLQEDLTPFYVLGLSPNASRIAVRFWYDGTAGQVAKNIRQYFDDISMVHKKNEPEHLSLFRLLVSTAIQTDSKNIQPKLSGDFMKAILTGTPYPKSLLNALILRVKAEQSKKDQKTGKSLQNVTYPRASLIKAILVRDARIYQKQDKEVDMSLDISNNNPGYRLGRLFAALERTQELANPNINSSIRDRFYGSASSTPVAAFPQLLKLKNHHISKLNNKGMAIYLEKQIGEIMDGLGDFPAHLNLADQGRFAIGYYHQRQAFFTKAS
jgi:CRISPR-associated protein Csd1